MDEDIIRADYMKIIYASSEIVPFATTGGLAEVGAAMPKALSRRGIEFLRVMPYYRQVAEGGFKVRDTGMRLEIPVGFKVYKGEVWLAEEPAPVTYFIRRDEFFDRTHLYGLPDRDYDDNFERFVFFQKAVVALIDALGGRIDVVHCCDWQAGLIPLFLRHGIQGMGRTMNEKTVFTIHNLVYQGIYPGAQYALTNLPFFCFSVECMEFYGNVNCMKAGITASNLVTTVSRTYAQEIQTDEFGCGLHGVLSGIRERLVGIVNGVDYTVWNPMVDDFIIRKYGPENLDAKRECREDLARILDLKLEPDTLLIGMVTRLVNHKGLDILSEALPALMEKKVALVILGVGQGQYHALCEQAATKWPGRFATRLQYDTALAHKIEAGADVFLLPSRIEPCGLNQLYSLKYGTVPIVHATGGLEDTIEDISDDGAIGNGFKFKAYTSDGLLSAVQRALDLHARPDVWRAIMLRGMGADFSWDRVADDYQMLYHRLTS